MQIKILGEGEKAIINSESVNQIFIVREINGFFEEYYLVIETETRRYNVGVYDSFKAVNRDYNRILKNEKAGKNLTELKIKKASVVNCF